MKEKKQICCVRHHLTNTYIFSGYYKVADKTKLIQRRLMYRHADNSEPVGFRQGKSATSSGANTGAENTREARHMMRRIASEFGSDASDLIKYNQLMVSLAVILFNYYFFKLFFVILVNCYFLKFFVFLYLVSIF